MRITRRLVIALVLGLVLVTITDVLLIVTGHEEAEIWGGTYVDYWAAFGFFWYMIIVFLSKFLGRFWLERREDYYHRNDEAEDE